MIGAPVLRVLLPFAAGYFLSYLYRSVNAVISPDLSASLSLGPATLGLLTSAYFLAFAAFQLPLGVLLDRFGPRRVEACLLLFAAAGAVIFAVGESLTTLIVGRALIGLGVSACLMAAFKAFTLWYPSERWPLLNGTVMAVGALGALAATAPVEILLRFIDWRQLFLLLGAATVLVSCAIFYIVPDHRDQGAARTSLGDQLQGVLDVFRSRRFWRIVPITALSQGTFLSVQGLWAAPWLRDVAGFGRSAVATHLFMIPVAMIAGYFAIGAFAERLSRIGVRPVLVAGCGMLAFMLVQFGLVLDLALPPWLLWAAFGFFGTTGILPYAILSQSFPRELAGRVNTGANVIAFGMAFLAQWGIGTIIGAWPASAVGGYPPSAYQAAFGTALLLQVLAFVWLVLPRSNSTARF